MYAHVFLSVLDFVNMYEYVFYIFVIYVRDHTQLDGIPTGASSSLASFFPFIKIPLLKLHGLCLMGLLARSCGCEDYAHDTTITAVPKTICLALCETQTVHLRLVSCLALFLYMCI